MLGPSASTLITLGALDANLIAQENEWWRFITPWFLSGGIIHWLLNIVSMIILGRMLERAHGSLKVAGIWCVAALCGTVTSALFLQPSVGASGGIFGMVGAVLADIWINWHILYDPTIMPGEPRSKCASVTVLAVEAVFLIIVGLTPFIDNYAHLGGFFGGLFASLTLIPKIDYEGFFHKERACAYLESTRRRVRWLWLSIPALYCVVGIILVYTLDGTYSVCTNVVCRR
jgi:membrane associated rhomboid family serine protease